MKIPVAKEKAELIENITEFDLGKGKKAYCIHFKEYEDAIWCKSISDIYLALEQFCKNHFVNTNEASEVII